MSTLASVPLSNDGSEAINRTQSISQNSLTSLPPIDDKQAVFEYFQIDDVLRFIRSTSHSNNVRRVALQMQDSLLPYACEIASLIEAAYKQSNTQSINQSASQSVDQSINHSVNQLATSTTQSIHQSTIQSINQSSSQRTNEHATSQTDSQSIDCYVLADTAYSPCCVDTVASAHCSADCLIHFGIACLTPANTSIPCFHVFGHAPINQSAQQSISQSIMQIDAPKIIVFADLEYQHALPAIKSLVDESKSEKEIVFALAAQMDQSINQLTNDLADRSIVGHHFTLTDDLIDYSLLFIGNDESVLLRNLALNTPSNNLSFLDISQSTSQSINQPTAYSITEASLTPSVSRTLARRYYLTQKAANSNVIGLLVGSLASASTRPLLARLRSAIRKQGKRCYTVTVGQINEAKLSNFPDIDIWCLFACPLTVLIDSQYWHKDVITAWEMDAVLSGRQWDGQYSTELAVAEAEKPQVVQSSADDQSSQQSTSDDDELFYDSLTGKLRPHSKPVNQSSTQSTSLIPAFESSLIARSIIDHQLINRSFNGLETREQRESRLLNDDLTDLKELKFATVQQGLTGIASKYSKETT